jgi:hypothetical protein
MAMHQETTTVRATRPELRSLQEPWRDAHRPAHLPGRLPATVAGGAAIVVGAWGGIAPYVGHALHYGADGSATWTWNLEHGLLSLLPGAMAVVAGVLLVAASWTRRKWVQRVQTAGLAGVTALLGLSAIWFLIGAWVWPIYFSSHVLVAASPVHTFASVLGYYAGEGFILAVVAGVTATWVVHSLRRAPQWATR